MVAATAQFSVHFPADYDAQSEHETPSRGYLSGVEVCLEGGSRYALFFIDPMRLQQDLASVVQCGKACLAEVNMIVLTEVTTESIRKAVEELAREGFFQHLKPL